MEIVEGSPGWYRYHPFFRDMLRAELDYLAPDRAVELHRRAAIWLADNGMLGPAVRHAVAGLQWATAAQFVVDDLAVGELIQGSERDYLFATLSAMPAGVQGAPSAIVRAALAVSQGDAVVAQRELEQAQTSAVAQGPDGRSGAAAQRLANRLIASLTSVQDTDAALSLQLSTEAVVELDGQPPDRLAAHPGLVAMVMTARAIALVRVGEIKAGRSAFAAAADVAEAPGCDSTLVFCLSHLALLDAVEGELRRAAERAKRALGLVRSADLDACGWWEACSRVALCWVALQQGDASTARKRITDLSANGGVQAVLPELMLELAAARLATIDGDLDRAIQIAHSVRERAVTSAPWVAAIAVEEEAASALSGSDAACGRRPPAVALRTG